MATDDQNPDSTAVAPPPVQQAASPSTDPTPDAKPSPQPTQAPNVQDVVNNPTQDLSNHLDTSNGVGGGPIPNVVRTDSDPTQPNTGVTGKMPLIPSQPMVAAPDSSMSTPAQPHPWVHSLLATAKAFATGAAGGQMYQTTIDNNGNTVRTPIQPSGKQIGMAIALEALTGAFKGAGEHGPGATGRAAAAGVEQGEQIAKGREETQTKADQTAQQDYIRKFETFKTNLSQFEAMQAAGKHDYDMANMPVEQNAGAMKYWRENTPDVIIKPDVSEEEAMAADHTKVYPVPTMTVPRINPETGDQMWQDIHGRPVPPNTPWAHAAWDHRYALIDNNADVQTHDEEGNLDQGLQTQITQGAQPQALANAGQGTKIPGSTYIAGNATTTVNSAFGRTVQRVIDGSNHYRALIANAKGQAGPNSFDTTAGGQTDNVWALFHGNIDNMNTFITQHEGQTQADGSPSRSARDNNPGNLVADASWHGPVDDKNLPPGQKPFRVYPDKQSGSNALDEQLMAWKKENPNESIDDFFKRYTTAGNVDPKTGLNDQQRYVAAALKYNGAGDANNIATGKLPNFDLNQFLRDNPDAPRAITAFNRAFATKNPTGSIQVALDNMKDVRQKSLIIKALGNDQQAAIDYDGNRHNDNTAVLEQTRNQAKLAYNDQKRQQDESAILDRNKETIQAILNGSAIDLRSVLTMRAYDREIVTNELEKRSGGTYSAASIQNMIDLNKEIVDKSDPNSFGSQVQNYQTAFGHTAAADQDLKILKTILPGQDVSPYLNKPVNAVLKQLQAVNPEAAQRFVRYQINLHNASTDWQNLLNRGHALHESDKDIANSILTDTTPFTTAHAAFSEYMSSAAVRIQALDEKYGTIMTNPSHGSTERAHYPNMLPPETVTAIGQMNDPETMQRVAHMQSNGTVTGGPNGLGSPGKEVGLMLTPAAPKAGTPWPTGPQGAKMFQRYKDVYGNKPEDVQRAAKANGWDVSK